MRGSAAACGSARETRAAESPGRRGVSMRRLALLLAFVLAVVSSAHAQVQQLPAVVSLADAQGQDRPAEFPLLDTTVEFRFPTQNDRSLRDVRTYIMQAETSRNVSLTSRGRSYWEAEPVMLDDAERFWKSGRFESLWVDVFDDRFENGLAGKRVVLNFVEHADAAIPTADYPTPPLAYRRPPGGERLYPPPEG